MPMTNVVPPMCKLLLVVLPLVLVTACGGEREEAINQSPVPGSPIQVQDYAQPDTSAFPSNTRIRFATLRPGDVVEVTIPEDPRFSGGLRRAVDALGRLPVPLIGPVPAEGLLPERLAQEIASSMAKFYSTDPECEVVLAEPVQREALVMGAVNAQGAVSLQPDDTLLSVIAKAAGVETVSLENGASLSGNQIVPKEARIIRDDGRSVAFVDLRPLLAGISPQSDVRVAPGDIIQVAAPELETIVVLGEVNTPGPVVLEPGLDLVQILGLAGGATEDASLGNAILVRHWWRPGDAMRYNCDFGAIYNGYGAALPVPKDRDVLIMPRKGIATLNYYLQQLTPSLLTVLTTQAILDQ